MSKRTRVISENNSNGVNISPTRPWESRNLAESSSSGCIYTQVGDYNHCCGRKYSSNVTYDDSKNVKKLDLPYIRRSC